MSMYIDIYIYIYVYTHTYIYGIRIYLYIYICMRRVLILLGGGIVFDTTHVVGCKIPRKENSPIFFYFFSRPLFLFPWVNPRLTRRWIKTGAPDKNNSGWLQLLAGFTRKKASARRVNRKIANSTRNQRVFFSRYLAANYVAVGDVHVMSLRVIQVYVYAYTCMHSCVPMVSVYIYIYMSAIFFYQ